MILLSVVSAQVTMREEDQTRLADGLYSRGLFDLALEEYERLLEQVPNLGNREAVTFRAAESARQLERNGVARPYYTRVIKMTPDSDFAQRARYRLAEMALEAGDTAEAGRRLKELLTSRPGASLEAPARFLLGQVLEADDESDLARAQYREVVRKFPEDDLAGYALLRFAALDGTSTDQRRSAYREGLTKARNDNMRVEALWGLASLETVENNHDTAAQLYWTLWTEHAEHPRVRDGLIYLAWSQLQAERFEQALTLYRAATETQRVPFADTWEYMRAVALQRLDREQEALKAFEVLLNTFPESRFRASAGYEAASLYAAAGNHSKVLQFAEEVRQVSGREAEGLWMLAESARATGENAVAIRMYSRLLQEHAQSPLAVDAMYVRALLMRTTDPLNAAGELDAFARRVPEDARVPEALRIAGDLHVEEGNLTEALSRWEASLRASEEPDPALIRRTAMLAVRLEKEEEAERYLNATLSANLPQAQKAEARYWLGVVRERNGKTEAASEAYTLALAAAPNADWSGSARMRLGALYQSAGKEEEALAAFLPLVKKNDPALSDGLLIWLLDQAEYGEHPEDQLVVAKALQNSGRSDPLKELGAYAEADALVQLDRKKDAVRAWRRGLNYESQSQDAAQAARDLGTTLLELKRPEEALTAYTTAASIASALELERLHAEALAGLGKAEQAQGNWEAAGRHFLSVSLLFDDPELIPTCLAAAAESFDRAGQPERAAAARRELAQRYPDSEESASIPSIEETP